MRDADIVTTIVGISKDKFYGEGTMGQTEDPLVSICCITYNHEDYIRSAIEGFLMQKTDFPFEVIIHDDASTDRTTEIIREYEERYPDIIKPIYQTENQYAKGGNSAKISIMLTFKAASGKYIALCDGDDYWIDPLKLQKQITEMEKHPECYICFHPAIRRWVDGSRADEMLGLHSDKITVFPMEEVILGGGEFMHTGSIALNRLVIPRVISFFDIAKEAPVSDYYIQMLGAENGGALYLNDIMSVYRSAVPDSWSERVKRDSNNLGSWLRISILTQDKLNTFTGNKYTKLFDSRKERCYSDIIRSPFLNINMKRSIIDADIAKVGIKDRILWNTVYKHPCIVELLNDVRRFVAGSQP